MKSLNVLAVAVVILNCTGAQNSVQQSNNKDHTSENSLDWQGGYRGILPCEGCDGAETTVSLSKDLQFKMRVRYLGDSDSATELSGRFNWNKNGNSITLTPLDNQAPVEYFVGENTLTLLDSNGNKVSGDANRYVLSKSNYDILEKYWKLVELNGKPVRTDSTFSKEAHIIFKDLGNRVIGNGGCNTISGNYRIEGLNRINISRVIATKMVCPRMDMESEFLNTIQQVDNFSLNGDTLTISKARMAPLARFHAVYFK